MKTYCLISKNVIFAQNTEGPIFDSRFDNF